MEEKLKYERVPKRQNTDIRGSLNKVAQSSDVIVKRLEDGSVEGIKLEYQHSYSRTGPNISMDILKEWKI